MRCKRFWVMKFFEQNNLKTKVYETRYVFHKRQWFFWSCSSLITVITLILHTYWPNHWFLSLIGWFPVPNRVWCFDIRSLVLWFQWFSSRISSSIRCPLLRFGLAALQVQPTTEKRRLYFVWLCRRVLGNDFQDLLQVDDFRLPKTVHFQHSWSVGRSNAQVA